MTLAHLDAVVDIESVSHLTPWTRGNFADSLAAGHAASVVLEEGAVAAYAVAMPLPGEAELLNITVAPEVRRHGVGRELLAHVLDAARTQGAERIFLEVRASNLPARALYRRSGFAEVGLRKGYYASTDNQREDAVLMAKELQA
ncbi:MAG TPA: ribosomal protein S18-alanine N-acetyltransferase [Rhodocyclaceae bacterium]|nr:ribosomal protein S18-alanine N-acetyltransferase [Rhodocyclaceae bacterium]